MPRDQTSLVSLGRQVYPKQSNIIAQCYEKVVAENADSHGYLLLNLHPKESRQHMLLSHVFDDDKHLYCYVPTQQ